MAFFLEGSCHPSLAHNAFGLTFTLFFFFFNVGPSASCPLWCRRTLREQATELIITGIWPRHRSVTMQKMTA